MPKLSIPLSRLAGEPFYNYDILTQHEVDISINVDHHPPEQHYPGHFDITLKSIDNTPNFMNNDKWLSKCIEEFIENNVEWVQEELTYQQERK